MGSSGAEGGSFKGGKVRKINERRKKRAKELHGGARGRATLFYSLSLRPVRMGKRGKRKSSRGKGGSSPLCPAMGNERRFQPSLIRRLSRG